MLSGLWTLALYVNQSTSIAPTLQKVLYLVLRYSSHQHYLGMGTDQVIIPRYKVQEGTDQVEIPRYKVRVKSKYLGTRYRSSQNT